MQALEDLYGTYLTPERTKPITSRKLGDVFSKEAILAALAQNASRIIPSVSQRPDTFVTPAVKPEIEKLIDLDAERAEGKDEGYIHWGRVFDLKTMAKTLFVFAGKRTDRSQRARRCFG